eukprot:355301-Chlamydomonas_euryale.AAC.8
MQHLEYPDEWKGPNGVPRPGAPSQPVTAPMVRTSVAAGGPAVRPPAHVPQVMQASVRPPAANAPVYRPMAQASPQMAGPNSGQGSVPGRVPAPAPGRGQAAPGRGPAPAMAAGRGQAPAMAAGRGSMPGRGPAPGRGMAPAPGQGGPAPGRGAPAPGRVAAVAAAPVKTALPAKPDAAATAAAAMELSKSLAAKAAVEDADDDGMCSSMCMPRCVCLSASDLSQMEWCAGGSASVGISHSQLAACFAQLCWKYCWKS